MAGVPNRGARLAVDFGSNGGPQEAKYGCFTASGGPNELVISGWLQVNAVLAGMFAGK
jgi:hypothetical protein